MPTRVSVCSELCRCNGLSVVFARALHQGGEADDHPAPIGWRCAGHASRSLPFVLDGVDLVARETFEPELVGRILRGELPAARPAWLGPAPAEWLVRVWHTLADRAAADRLSAVVVSFVAIDRPELASALHYLSGLPAVAAPPDARERLAAISQAELGDARAPYPPTEPLSRLLKRARGRLGV